MPEPGGGTASDGGSSTETLGVRLLIPQLNYGEQRELFERIAIGGRIDADFVIMMLLSTALAAFGLLEGSTAVVIGAMLVAPLMGPLVATGLALVQADVRLYRTSFRAAVLGVLIGLAVSIGAGIVNPGFEPSLEMEARGMPDLIDLVIAFLSGAAGAYALGRPNVAATMAGVAIAAALVPPLAVVGVSLMGGYFLLAGAAAILLATNLAAIVLGSALMFKLMGVSGKESLSTTPAWVRTSTRALLLAIVILVAPLLLNALEKGRRGQLRPAIYPLAYKVRNAIREIVDEQPGIEIIMMSRDSVEPETGIRVVLNCSGPVEAGFSERLEQAILVERGSDVQVRIFLMQSATQEG